MDLEIITPTPDFNFKTISLADPKPLNGQAGFYFTQLNVGEEGKSLCLQLPECMTKQGMVSIKNVNYLDLMFERSNHDELMHWIEQLEYTCQDIIDSKKELWFQTELTRDDIETMMTQVIRLYQSGKYMLMRVFVEPAGKSGNKCIAYDENEIGFDLDGLEPNKAVVPLIMIEGVKFSSRSFEIALKLVQVMVIGKTEKKSSCLIKRKHHLDNKEQATAVQQANEAVQQAEAAQQAEAVQQANEAVPATAVQQATVLTALQQATVLTAEQQVPAAEQAPAAEQQAPAAEQQAPVLTAEQKTPGISNNDDLEEITIDFNTTEPESINLKKPNDVYYELYKKAREKAKHCRIAAIEAYLEAKQIKTKYMLFDDDDDSDDDLSDEEDDLDMDDD